MSKENASLLGGRYRLVRELGRGGMACVYLARDETLQRDVAVKLLPPAVLDEGAAKRLEREARLAAAIHHPNAVVVYDFGADGGRPYLVSEYVEGTTLAGLADRGLGRFAESAALLLEPVASALGAAHARGVVHRDVKPANVLVSTDGQVKLADFGIAIAKAATSRLTGEGLLTGSLPYLAPERIDGREAEPPADVFSLGVSLYELASGTLPFGGDSPAAMAAAVLAGRCRPLAIACPTAPPSIAALCHRCLSSDLAVRPRDGAELAALLAAVLAEEGIAEPAAELQRYLRAPEAYERALGIRQGRRCADQARAASSRGDLIAAAQFASRAATYQPGLEVAELVTPPRRRGRWGVALALGALAAVGAGGAWSVHRRRLEPRRLEPIAGAPPAPAPDSSKRPAVSLPLPVAEVRPRALARRSHGGRGPLAGEQGGEFPPAHVSLRTEPWAQVFVDGQSVGYTPTVRELTLPPGRHLLRLVNPYHPIREAPLTLGPGQSLDLDYALGAEAGAN